MMGSMLCGVGTKQVWRGLAGKTVIREVGLVMVTGHKFAGKTAIREVRLVMAAGHGLAGKTVIREVGLVMVAGRGARWGVRQAEKVGWHGGVQGGGCGWGWCSSEAMWVKGGGGWGAVSWGGGCRWGWSRGGARWVELLGWHGGVQGGGGGGTVM